VETTIWRHIIKKPLTKIGIPAAAAVLFVMLTLFNQSIEKVWAIEQTVDALGRLRTLQITGVDYWGEEGILFSCSLQFHEEDDLFDMRFESGKQTVVVRGKQAWAYWADENVVKVYSDVTDSRGMMRDLQFWYKLAELNPWITGKVFAVLRGFSDQWEESYPSQGDLSREVTVTCNYKPLNSSFQFVCDMDSKLIVEGKYWRNAAWEGEPVCYAQSFIYNEEIAEDVFVFEIPPDAQVIYRGLQDPVEAKFANGEKLFRQKQYTEAIAVFRQIAEDPLEDPHLIEESLMMIGICYGWLGDYQQSIAAYEKAVRKYGQMRGWIEATYYYLGNSYMQTGRIEEARQAFQNCLILGEGVRDPDGFPMNNARLALISIGRALFPEAIQVF